MTALLLALALQAPAPADTVALPWPVAIGGVQYHVLVDGDTVSSHATRHGGLREGARWHISCDFGELCEVRVVTGQRWRFEQRLIPRPRLLEDDDPDDFEVEDPDALFIWPRDLDIGPADTIQLWSLGIIGDRTFACTAHPDPADPHPHWREVELEPAGVCLRRDGEVRGVCGWTPGDVPGWCPVAPAVLQEASAGGRPPSVQLPLSPEPGSLLVAFSAHRIDWPEARSAEGWERRMLHVEPSAEVGSSFRKGVAAFTRRAEPGETGTSTVEWTGSVESPDREAMLVVQELGGLGEFIGAAVTSSGAESVDRLFLELPDAPPGSVVAVVFLVVRDTDVLHTEISGFPPSTRHYHEDPFGAELVAHTFVASVGDVDEWAPELVWDLSGPAAAVVLLFSSP